MKKNIKTANFSRSDYGAFEQESQNPYYPYQQKKYLKNGLIESEIETRMNGQKEWGTIYKYDDKDRMVMRQTFYYQEDTEEKIVYIYDNEGLLIRDENFFGEDLFETVRYQYNQAKQLILRIREDEDGYELEKQETSLDENGNILSQYFWQNGEKEKEINYIYNDNYLCINEIHINILEDKIEKTEYAYNEFGKKTKSITQDSNGNMIAMIEIEYDENLNPVTYFSETSGYYRSKAINSIKYDDQNRQIENEYFDVMNSFLMSKEKREYDEDGNIIAEEIFEINPQAGMKKNHYKLTVSYDYFED